MPIENELLGLILRKERERRQLSQESLAELSGLSRNHIGKIERGIVNLSFSNLRAIASGLNMLTSELLIKCEYYERESNSDS